MTTALSLAEAQQLHELVGLTLEDARNGETGDIAELERALEIAALLVSDLSTTEDLAGNPEAARLAEARRYYIQHYGIPDRPLADALDSDFHTLAEERALNHVGLATRGQKESKP